ncbi:MAG: ureidoglycolate lyase [Pseudomonadota bacterium]
MVAEFVLPVGDATPAAFAPFGALIAPPAEAPTYRGIQASTWPTGFSCADPVAVMYTRFGWQEPVFSKVERHRGVTQTFVALAPRAFVVAVAAPTTSGLAPMPESLRAFLVPAGHGVIFGEEVWHALDRFLLEPEPLDCVMLTSAVVQAELEAQYRGGGAPSRTELVDFADQGARFRLALPPC